MTISPFSPTLDLLPALSPVTALGSPSTCSRVYIHTDRKEAGGGRGSHKEHAWRWGEEREMGGRGQKEEGTGG